MARLKTMQDMIETILKLVDTNHNNRAQEDLIKTNHAAAEAVGLVSAFSYMGIQTEFETCMDSVYEMVKYIRIEGVTVVKNGEINWKAYADAVLDRVHNWGGRLMACMDRED